MAESKLVRLDEDKDVSTTTSLNVHEPQDDQPGEFFKNLVTIYGIMLWFIINSG